MIRPQVVVAREMLKKLDMLDGRILTWLTIKVKNNKKVMIETTQTNRRILMAQMIGIQKMMKKKQIQGKKM